MIFLLQTDKFQNLFWIKAIPLILNCSRHCQRWWRPDLFTNHLTEEGSETIQFFINKLSPAIRDDIDAFFKEHKYELKNDVSVKADYFPNANQEFSVRCQIIENNASLMELVLTVPSEHEAEAITNNWRQKNEEIYAFLMKNLL